MIGAGVPQVEDLEGRFRFIVDDTLRRNVTIAFQYTIFLLAVLAEAGAEGSSVASSTHKDIIMHTASVVEACTHYVLREYLRTGRAESADVMPREKRHLDLKEVYRISGTERIISAREVQRAEKLHPKTQLKSLNEAALNAGIFDREVFTMAEKIRARRNKIHLAGLETVDSAYTKIDSDSTFALAKSVLNALEIALGAPQVS